jgi:hypothetical protein
MPTLSPCPDCGRVQKMIRGYCNRCGTRRRRAGTLPNLTDEDRFWASVRKDPDGCWRWTASGVRRYGRVMFGGERLLAHRVSWTLHRGAVPPGIEVCHDCPAGDDPSCVNPEHLFLGTHAENMADGARKGRVVGNGGRRGEEMGRAAKLTDATAAEALAMYRAGAGSYSVLARRFGVSAGAIQQLVQRKTWRHLDSP